MWATLAKVLGGPLIKKGFNWLMGKQANRKEAQAHRAEWELTALKRSSTFLRIVSFVTILGPIYHAYFLVMWNTPVETPEDVANAIQTVFGAFPEWYTAMAVGILLAIWGKREMDTGNAQKTVVNKKEKAPSEERASKEYTNR